MSVVYLEDVIKVVSNKFVAINIAGQRARQLNEQEIPFFAGATERKPASLAIEELVNGDIDYNELSAQTGSADDLSLFHSSSDESESAENLEELLPDPVYVNNSNIIDPDEGEEGL
jgi:DNA-directed RNA polymerase omega subunit